ncbi:hypothetical protein [Pseudoduganella violacea]|uniref:Uncharacterized protein n=1 Tax=Pseudoduganella violacea TaxID=1715466 RepID=A0A7W5B9S2_9BURK|nr:hypothetical protein [Pseudoduganella violacea]MBB3119043.1 hypothetical protein [Pseudoduganella violacea]
MNTVLVLFFLTIQSSYQRNEESEATEEAFDTIQFIVTDKGAWRVKTFASDQDVHAWAIQEVPDDIIDLAVDSTNEEYGDVIAQAFILETNKGIAGLQRELRQRGLSEHLEIARTGMPYWTPEGSSYSAKSSPNKPLAH